MTKATTRRAKKDRLPPLWGRDEHGYKIQPTTEEIVDGVQQRGGDLWLDDDYRLRARLPRKNLKEWKKLLKDRRASVFQYLLGRKPKIEIPVACRCAEKPCPHLVHDPPRGDGQPEARVKGDLKQLPEVLIRCQSQAGGWDMADLVEHMKEISKRKSE